MGGYGSGRQSSYFAKKGTTELCPKIQLANLKSQLQSRQSSLIVKSWGDEHVIKVTWTECNYGGLRPWFLCQKCGKKAAILYLKRSKLGCRICQRLTYLMSQSDKLNRTTIQNRRTCEKRLRGRPDVIAGMTLPPSRPKGMHRKTYEKLCDRLQVQDEKRCQIFYRQAIRKYSQILRSV